MNEPQVGEIFTIGLDTCEVGGKIAGFLADGIVVDFSDRALAFLAEQGLVFKAGYLTEARRMGNPCWKGYRALGLKKKNGKQVPNCIPKNEDAAGVGVVKNSRDPRYMTATMGDQNDVTGDTLNKELRAFKLAEAEYHGKKVPLGKKLPGDVKNIRSMFASLTVTSLR